jgi:hypothetical protein
MLKNLILQNTFTRTLWSNVRSRRQVINYRRMANTFQTMAREKGLYYHPEQAQSDIRNFVSPLAIKPKKGTQVHSLIFCLSQTWGMGVLSELNKLGPVSLFDYLKQGYTDISMTNQKRVLELNQKFFDFVAESHKKCSVDWILMTHTGYIVLKETIRKIRKQFGIPIVNQWLDCKQNFEAGMGPHGQDLGQKDIASEFDMVWTSSRSVCEWYMAVGGRPYFLPEGFSPDYIPRIECEKTSDIGFFGQCYGNRADYIHILKKAGLKVRVGGFGWKDAPTVPDSEIGKFIASSKVSLGMGGMGYSMDLTTVKGRDFEIPGAGAVYLTTFNPDLTNFFDIGKEIFCYRTVDEMVEITYELTNNETLCKQVSERAYRRSLREHRWIHRYKTVLKILGILGDDTKTHVE